MKKSIMIFLIISVLSSCTVFFSGCTKGDSKIAPAPTKAKDGIYRIDTLKVVAENEAIIAQVNSFDFEKNHFVHFTQDWGLPEKVRFFLAFKDKKKYIPEVFLKYDTVSPVAEIVINLKKRKGKSSNVVQLYEFVTSAEVNAVSAKIDGVSRPVWCMVTFDSETE